MRACIFALLAACGSSSTGGDSASPDGNNNTMPDAPVTPTPKCDGTMPPQADSTWTLTVGSLERTANVHVPASYNATTPTALVINVHGRTSNASQQATLSHMIAKADAEGFIVIHPQAWGSPTSWNTGGGCCDPAYSNNIDDVGFIRALLDEATSKLCIDPKRVYVTGLSNGGYLSHRLACEMSDRFAAIGPVAGILSYQDCAPTRAMPVWSIHGDADPIVQYSYAVSSADYWAAKNQCTTEATTYQNGVVTCVTHGNCTAGADVVLCTVRDGGHQWFGGDTLPFLGNNTTDIIATDAVWDFFAAHSQ